MQDPIDSSTVYWWVILGKYSNYYYYVKNYSLSVFFISMRIEREKDRMSARDWYQKALNRQSRIKILKWMALIKHLNTKNLYWRRYWSLPRKASIPCMTEWHIKLLSERSLPFLLPQRMDPNQSHQYTRYYEVNWKPCRRVNQGLGD